MNTLGFYGCGNMGQAILKNILHKKIIDSSQIMAYTHTKKSSEKIEQAFGVQTTQNTDDIETCSVLLLGCKPQVLPQIPLIQSPKTIISFLAGTNIKTLQTKFPQSKIVRTMPNLPIQYGRGMTAIFFDPEKTWSPEEKEFVQSIFQSGGKIIELTNEDQMHSFTALCGSGPAYLLYFMEILVRESQKYDFTPEESFQMAQQLLLGTASMMEGETDPQSFQTLRQKVTSKKGTTEAGIKTFQDSENNLMEKIIRSAVQRSKELGNLQ